MSLQAPLQNLVQQQAAYTAHLGHRPRILVALSGGVDSALSAYLLQAAGFQIEACFMKNWMEDDQDHHCPAAIDFQDARAVCDRLQIPLHAVNFATQYWDEVFAHCLSEYRAGRTPNPDILCNRHIKFKVFLDYALAQGFDAMATGHYAQIERHDSPNTGMTNISLKKAADPTKDQSYFLYAVEQAALKQTLFPIGALHKTEVRSLAEAAGLANAHKKDSTGICFIGERKFKQFLSQYLPAQPGTIESSEGQHLGTHDGLMFYTIGQRQGLKIGGQSAYDEAPWYVLHKDLARNVLVVGQGVDHPALYRSSLQVDQVHWIAGNPPIHVQAQESHTLHCSAKIRYRQADVPCTLQLHTAHQGVVHFASPQRAITPGQSVVFYQQDFCLGGGIIQ